MLDSWEREARKNIPPDYKILHHDPVRPDDLIWSWASSEWLRADSDKWMIPVKGVMPKVEDCVCVVRSTRIRYVTRKLT